MFKICADCGKEVEYLYPSGICEECVYDLPFKYQPLIYIYTK